MKGRITSEETKKKIGDANRNNPNCGWARGKKLSRDHCRNISKARKGIIFTKKHCENISKAQRGKPKPSIRGENNHGWKGGRKKNNIGYWMILIPENKRINGKRYVYEHRLVIEKHIGRRLRKKEVVHHINNIKDDNRIENLQLFKSNSEHMETCHKKRPRRK